MQSVIYKILRKFSECFLKPLFVGCIRKFCSVDESLIVFMSRPDYSDNSLAFYNYMKSTPKYAAYNIWWAVSSKKENSFYNSVRLYNSFGVLSYKSLKKLMTAKFVFSTHDFMISKSDGLPGQNYILLWHGCGYKDKISKNVSHIFDKACVPGPLFVKTKSKLWNVTEDKFIVKGYPRYDWMLDNSPKAEEMARNLRGNAQEKIVLWMPTFRNSVVNKNSPENTITQFPLMKDQESWNCLDLYCKEIGVKLLIKLHAVQKNYDIDFKKLKNIKLLSNDDFEKNEIQMYEFLPFSDALISDYSSIAVDYLVLNKPIAFALDDYDLYKKLRGFVFDDPRKYMPGHHLYIEKDLYAFLKDVANGTDSYLFARKKMINECIYVSKSYCASLADDLGL